MTTELLERQFSSDQARDFPSMLANLVNRARGAFSHWRQSRRQRRVLHGLSDRVLRDIGLSDAEIDDVRASEPFPRVSPEQLGRLLAR